MLIKFLLSVAMVLVCLSNIFGQETSSVGQNANWKSYQIGSNNISAGFPKLPILYGAIDACRSFERKTYAAYADEVIYTAIVTSRRKEKPPSWCDVKETFTRKTLDTRIGELIISKTLAREGSSESQKRTLLTGERDHVLVVDDTENGRFVELWMTFNRGLRVDKKKFWDSLQFNLQPETIGVKDGAAATIGDLAQKAGSAVLWDGLKTEDLNFGFVLAHKPQARYTESARDGDVQGTVRLKLTLLASGSVGTIVPITRLPQGLTEQAIAAARRIVFLPKKVRGINQSVIVTVEYNFSIY